MKDMAIIGAGLRDGDQVITTDLVPAIEGMLLSPELNEDLMSKINASGKNQL